MRARRALLGGAAGLALALAIPPLGVGVLGLATFALLALALDGASPREAAIAGWCMGVAAFGVAGWWLVPVVPRFTGAPMVAGWLCWILASAWMALAPALGGWLAARTRSVFGAALGTALSLWVALRYGPRFVPFPLALPLIELRALAQSADLVGVEGLGALLLGAAVACLNALRRRDLRALAAAGIIPLALAGYGALRGPGVSRAMHGAATIDVALVQPVVGASLRWDEGARGQILEHLQSLTRVGAAGAALTVWHEAAYPWELAFAPGIDGVGAPAVMSDWSAPLLFGAMARPLDAGDRRRFNAAFVRHADGSLGAPVAKRILLPFGEYVPGAALIPSVHAAVTGGEGVSAGPAPQRMRLGRREIGVLTCLEDVLPEAGAELAGVDLLVNLTNDAWFDGAQNPQHLLAARWRAIELRRELVRASNAGHSAHVNALGDVVAVAEDRAVDVLRVRPRVAMAIAPVAPTVIAWGPRAALAVVVAGLWVARSRGERG